jgi:outer membrane protein assembly factor BamB
MTVYHATRRLAALLWFVATLSVAQDWPQWRGPNRDGIAPSLDRPSWPEKLAKKWQVTVGAGHSSPVVAAGRIYLHTRVAEDEVVSAIDLGSGKTLWQDRYAAPYTMNRAATGHGKGPKSTPVFNNGRLYTLGISGIAGCYDAATGKRIWQKEFASRFPNTSPLYGTAMSPLIDRGFVILHVGGHDGGALVALDAAAGDQRWSWDGDGPGYSSPVVAEWSGVRQVVTQSQSNIIGVGALDGRLLWKIPFTTPYVQNIVTPVLHNDMLIISGLEQPTRAYRLRLVGGKWTPLKVWENTDVSFYMSSPALATGRLYGLSNKRRGELVCLDASTGVLLWTGGPRTADNAAILVSFRAVMVLTTNSELIIAESGGSQYREIRRYTVADSPVWAHPAPAGDSFFIKDAETLSGWEFGTPRRRCFKFPT